MAQKDPLQPETLAYASRTVNGARRPVPGGAHVAIGACALLFGVATLFPGLAGLSYLLGSGLPHDLLLPTFAWLAIAIASFWAGIRWLLAGHRISSGR